MTSLLLPEKKDEPYDNTVVKLVKYDTKEDFLEGGFEDTLRIRKLQVGLDENGVTYLCDVIFCVTQKVMQS